jgi:hypothetical protein
MPAITGLTFVLGWPFEWPGIVSLFVALLPSVRMSVYHLRVRPGLKLGDIWWGMAQPMVLQTMELTL